MYVVPSAPGGRCLSLEDWPDSVRAVSAGLERTLAGLITAAAAIMAAVFVSFAAVDLVVIKAVGIGMGVAP